MDTSLLRTEVEDPMNNNYSNDFRCNGLSLPVIDIESLPKTSVLMRVDPLHFLTLKRHVCFIDRCSNINKCEIVAIMHCKKTEDNLKKFRLEQNSGISYISAGLLLMF